MTLYRYPIKLPLCSLAIFIFSTSVCMHVLYVIQFGIIYYENSIILNTTNKKWLAWRIAKKVNEARNVTLYNDDLFN